MRRGESLVYVLDDDEGFTDGLSMVKQDGDFLVDRVGLEEGGAFALGSWGTRVKGTALANKASWGRKE